MLWSFAEKLVPTKSPGEFNQALMDLGATVCTPTDPRCDACPVAACCRALAEQAQAEIPVPARRAEITETREAYVAIESEGRYLIYRRPEGQRWAGMWDFPRFELPSRLTGERRQLFDHDSSHCVDCAFGIRALSVLDHGPPTGGDAAVS